ncbi:MAG: ABC transporter permease, partial [Dehalococcoidia bacterium]
MSRFFVLVRKELKSIRNEKTIMFAIMIQFLIASCSSIMLVGVMAFYDPSSIGENTNAHINVGVVGDMSSPIVSFMMDR